MFENIIKFFKNIGKKEEKNNETENSKDAAKERLHLVLMQDRANVSADFLELMKQEIIEVIKKYIDVDEGAIDVRLTNIKNEARKVDKKELEKNKNEQKAEIEEQQENAQNNPEQEQKEQKEPKEQQEETKLEEEKKENKESEEKIKEKEETKNNHKKK